MYLVTVIPLVSTAHTDVLDYFAKDAIAPGVVVTIPVRKKKVHGLVVQSRPLREAKHRVKASDFAMRKIDSIVGASTLSQQTIAGFHSAAQYMATSIGTIISQSTPKEYIAQHIKTDARRLTANQLSTPSTPAILQLPFNKRIAWYTSCAEQEKLLIIVPTDDQAKAIAAQLHTGTTVVLSGKANQKKYAALNQSHIVIGTPNALGVIDSIQPTLLIVEHESDNRYIRRTRPSIDMRIVAECLARQHGIRSVFADTLVRVYTHARTDTDGLLYITPPVWPQFSQLRIMPYVLEHPPETSAHPISPFLNTELITTIRNHQGKTFVYVPRKGLAPSVVCQDCGTIVTCEQCGLPMKLVKKTSADGTSLQYYACAHPQHTIPAYNTCNNCTGHRLIGLGVTTLRIQEEVRRLVPDISASVLDQDEAPTQRAQRTIVDTFKETSPSILIGTSLALPYITNETSLFIVPSFDMLLSQPSADAQESVLRTVATIAERTHAPILLQTRLPHHPLFTALQNNTIDEWYNTERALRKRYQSTPFTTTLLIHAVLPRTQIDSFKQQIALLNLTVEAIGITSGKNKREIHATATIRLPLADWNLDHQEERLRALLRGLPPQYWIQLTSVA